MIFHHKAWENGGRWSDGGKQSHTAGNFSESWDSEGPLKAWKSSSVAKFSGNEQWRAALPGDDAPLQQMFWSVGLLFKREF